MSDAVRALSTQADGATPAAAASLRPVEGLRTPEVFEFYVRALGLSVATPPGDEPFPGQGKAAMADGKLVGLLTGGLYPDNDHPGADVLYLYGAVDPAWRRRGIGRALLAGLMEEFHREGRPLTLSVTLSGGEPDAAAAFLLQQGFSEARQSIRYERELTPDAVPQDGPSMPTAVYRGGDAAIETAIIDLYRRAYRGRNAIPVLTAESIQRQFEAPGFAYVLVFDGDRLIGHTACYVNEAKCYVDSIVIARSHWGSGASDALVHALFRHALGEGCNRIAGIAEESNRASRALMERHGLGPKEHIRCFRRTLQAG
jgi:GNAT superfamily N-acetyltransferase